MFKRISVEKFYIYGKKVQVKAGETLYNADSYRNQQYAYFLDRGVCALSRLSREGDERVYLYFREKKTIGFTQLLPSVRGNGGTNFRITAKTDCVVYRIDKERFDELLEKNDDFREFTMEVLCDNYKEILSRYHEAQDLTIPERIAALMLEHKTKEGEKWYLPDFFSHAEIASYLGTHVVTVSRIMAKLKKEGYIEKEGHRVVLTDQDKLKQLCSGNVLINY